MTLGASFVCRWLGDDKKGTAIDRYGSKILCAKSSGRLQRELLLVAGAVS